MATAGSGEGRGRIHERIENGFEAFGRLVVRRRYLVVVALALLTAGLASFMSELVSDNSAESFLRKSDPARVRYDWFRGQFGQDDQIIILARPGEVFAFEFLETLREIHGAIESEVPYLEEVTSLVNARNTRGEGDRLIVEDLLENWPENDAALAVLRERVLETPSYRNVLVDAEGEVTTITIRPFLYSTVDDSGEGLEGFEDAAAGAKEPRFLTDAEATEHVEALEAIVARYQTPELELHLAGGYVGNVHSTRMMMRDISVFLSVCIGVMGCLLFFLYRRVSAVLLPLLVVGLALVATLGIQAILGVPASVSGQIVPPLLLAVGICGAIHLLSLVYRFLAEGAERADAIAWALRHSGLAIVMASLTTAAGLMSFSGADLAQVANLGIVAPIGVMVALLYVVVLLPALLAIVPLQEREVAGVALREALGRGLAVIGRYSVRNPYVILAGSLLVVVFASFGAMQLKFSQNPIAWFPPDDPVRLAAELADDELGGANTVEFVVDTKEANGLHDPATLGRVARAIDASLAYDDGVLQASQALSILDVVRETNKALNENRHAFYAIPDDRRLLAQELLLFENSGSDDLEQLTDSQFQLARVSFRLPLVDDLYYGPFVERLRKIFEAEMGGRAEVEATGLGTLFARTFSVINVTMARSYAIALAVITPLLVLLIGNLRQGLVAMVPNLLPVFLTLSLMGALGIAIDNSSLLIGCIIIGLAVDDTIHFMHKFQRYYAASGDVEEAVVSTLETTGAALLFTSIVLACGFAVMTLAYMENVQDFGLITTFAAAVAFLSDIVVAPALLVLVSPRARAA